MCGSRDGVFGHADLRSKEPANVVCFGVLGRSSDDQSARGHRLNSQKVRCVLHDGVFVLEQSEDVHAVASGPERGRSGDRVLTLIERLGGEVEFPSVGALAGGGDPPLTGHKGRARGGADGCKGVGVAQGAAAGLPGPSEGGMPAKVDLGRRGDPP